MTKKLTIKRSKVSSIVLAESYVISYEQLVKKEEAFSSEFFVSQTTENSVLRKLNLILKHHRETKK